MTPPRLELAGLRSADDPRIVAAIKALGTAQSEAAMALDTYGLFGDAVDAARAALFAAIDAWHRGEP